MSKRGVLLVAVVCVACGVAAFGQSSPKAADDAAPKYEIYAVQYGHVPDFGVANLVSGADRERKIDIAMLVWIVKGGGRVILFDSGFYREQFLKQWKPQDFSKPSDAISKVGLKAEDVTDLVISHAHWDHVDGADLFPKAQVWIQKDEYQYYTGEAWQPAGLDVSTPQGRRAANAKHGGVDPDDVAMLVKINVEGRLHFVNGDDQQVFPGFRCYIGGKHTFQSQYCSVATRSGTVVLASDNMYLYENLDRHVPIAQTLDEASNLRAQDRMKQLVTKPEFIVPGHDPEQLNRFPKVAEGAVRID